MRQMKNTERGDSDERQKKETDGTAAFGMKREDIDRIFANPPEIRTERLFLRKMKKSDYRDMYEYAKNPEVTRYLTWEPHPNEDYTYRYLDYIVSRYKAGEFYDWAVVFARERKMIGTCGFTRFDVANNSGEIGYVLNPSYWGCGIAPEAVLAVMRFGFLKLNLHRIEARFMEGNDRSRRVMEKCGMTFEGFKRSSLFVKSSYKTIGTCAVLSEEFIRRQL